MRGSRRAQRGVALLGLLAVAVMVFAYVLTSRLNAASQFVGLDREESARVLAQAKVALIGYMAQQAAMPGEDNPGHLPCPEAPANYGTANEGIEAPFCSAQAIGRLPWRTLGLPKLVDAAGEPLWYAVSNGWHRPNSTTNLSLNSDSSGQLSLDGIANDAVALIIAPGPVLAAQAGTGCTAWVQSRPTTGAPDVRNYLECENAAFPANAAFVTSRPGLTFNDQVLRVAAADVIPALEAAVADRMQREIAPALRTVYTSSGYSGIPSSSPLYPYPAPFTNPGTSSYQGQSGLYQGLLPVNFAASMVDYAATPANASETLGYGYIMWQTCSWESAGIRLCEGRYHESDSEPWRPIRIEMTATFTNVAMGLRAIDTTRMRVEARDDGSAGAWLSSTLSHVATMNSNGSVTIRFWATLPNIDTMGWDTQADFRIRIERPVIGDHALLDPGNAVTGWFVRNEWFRLIYYATVRRNTAVALSTLGCIDSSDTNEGCLRFNDPTTRNIRALLVLAGRSLGNAARPNSTLADYVEYQNCDLSGGVCDPQTRFEQRPMRSTNVAMPSLNAPFNDRVVLVDWSGSLNANQIAIASPLRTFTLP